MRFRTHVEQMDGADPAEPPLRNMRPKPRWAALAGLAASLISPAVSAQMSAPVPQFGQLVSVSLFTLALVILILTYLRRHKGAVTTTTGRRPDGTGSARGSSSSTGFEAVEETDHPLILEAIGASLRRSRREGSDLSVVRLRLDIDLDDSDRYSRNAINETLLSIARMRAARLFLLGPDDYLLLFSGELPDQAYRIAEDFREGVVDLALTAQGMPLTASIGLCSGPVDAKSGAQHFIDCADAQLRMARKRGGNRVEAWQN